MAQKNRSLLFPFLVYLAFFASGAACLSAEVTFNRMLIVVVGNSLSATTMILVVFMGGLGLGSFLGGRFFVRRRPDLLPYLLLEAVIGFYVLLSPGLFGILASLFTSAAESIHARAGLTLVRVAVTSAALLLPATLMGATFPAMISGAVPDRPAGRGARTGYLYSINTLGAAIGCFAAGYHLLLEFGVTTTIFCTSGLYLLAVLCALGARAIAGAGPAPAPAAPVRPEEAGTLGADRRTFLAVATFLIGFVALAYEVLLTRLGILYLGNAVSVFPLVLTAFLLGTGISAVLGTRIYELACRTSKASGRFFGIVALCAGAAVMATPYVLLSDRVLGAQNFTRFADATPRNPWPILAWIVAPTVLIGGLLPVAIRMLKPGRTGGEGTRGAANLYALNTAGGLLGAGLANQVLVPWIGIERTLILLTVLCACVGAAALAPLGKKARNWAWLGAAVLILPLLLGLTLPGMMKMYAGKVARATGARSAEVKLVREGRAATVTVVDQADPSLGTYRDMYLNGVEEASTRYWHTQLFKLLGILPVLAHTSDSPKDVLVIAFGAGITAGSTLASESVRRLDVVDLNPDVSGINDLFKEVNGDVFHASRFHFHNDDGRNYLVTSGRKYDLIISDSTHPRAYDSWILYTEEFYRSVQRRLNPDGIFAQWVPVLGSMQGELMRIHLNTFRSVFPHATLWYVYGSDQAFLLGTPEKLALDAPRLQGQLDRLPAWFQAGYYQIDTVSRLAGFFWMDEVALRDMIGHETRKNRDGAHYFDKQSAVWPSPPQERLPFFQSSIGPFLVRADQELRAAAKAEQHTAGLLSLYGFFQDKEKLYQAYGESPENGDVRYFMAREFADSLPDPAQYRRNDAPSDPAASGGR